MHVVFDARCGGSSGILSAVLHGYPARGAVHADAPQPRQLLAASFWPDSTERQARTNLRRELHHLRVLLGNDPSLVVEPTTLMWRDWPTCRVDVCVFHRERQLALQALAAGDQHAMLEHGAVSCAHPTARSDATCPARAAGGPRSRVRPGPRVLEQRRRGPVSPARCHG